MDLSEFTIRLLLLFFPGIVCFFIVDALTVHFPRKAFEVFLFSFVYGVLSYVIYVLGRAIAFGFNLSSRFFLGSLRPSEDGQVTISAPGDIGLSRILSDKDALLDFVEIGLVSLAAILLAFFLAYAITHRWLYRFSKKWRLSFKFADPNVWAFTFNSRTATWATLRDMENNLMFCGYVDAFSDVEENAELLLNNVIVYNEKTGDELYRADRMYLSRSKDAVIVELPNPPTLNTPP